jgi:hypothetical protein
MRSYEKLREVFRHDLDRQEEGRCLHEKFYSLVPFPGVVDGYSRFEATKVMQLADLLFLQEECGTYVDHNGEEQEHFSVVFQEHGQLFQFRTGYGHVVLNLRPNLKYSTEVKDMGADRLFSVAAYQRLFGCKIFGPANPEDYTDFQPEAVQVLKDRIMSFKGLPLAVDLVSCSESPVASSEVAPGMMTDDSDDHWKNDIGEDHPSLMHTKNKRQRSASSSECEDHQIEKYEMLKAMHVQAVKLRGKGPPAPPPPHPDEVYLEDDVSSTVSEKADADGTVDADGTSVSEEAHASDSDGSNSPGSDASGSDSSD